MGTYVTKYTEPAAQSIKQLFLDLPSMQIKTHDLGTFNQNALDELEKSAIYVVAQDELRTQLRKEVEKL